MTENERPAFPRGAPVETAVMVPPPDDILAAALAAVRAAFGDHVVIEERVDAQ
jgi:hypothetical protein